MKTTAKSVAKKTAANRLIKKAAASPLARSKTTVVAKSVAIANRVYERQSNVRLDQMFFLPPIERIDTIRSGVPAGHVDALAKRMDVSKEALLETLGLSRATVNRKARNNRPLSQDESERLLGIEHLIGQVKNMIAESGDSEGFNAAKWVSNWLRSPLPALGGKPPASYMDTIEGQKLVSNLLATAQSGAYA